MGDSSFQGEIVTPFTASILSEWGLGDHKGIRSSSCHKLEALHVHCLFSSWISYADAVRGRRSWDLSMFDVRP